MEEDKIINIQKEIDKILKEEFEKLIQDNKDNFIIRLLIEKKIDTITIDKMIEELEEMDKNE